ncbi:MAG: ABC transporter permease [Chthoniobacterales bacterium]|nr:ABC transporter permease [Chthoniobacterales bacterium]
MITAAPEPIEAAAPSAPGLRAWRRFRANQVGMAALAIVIVLAAVALTFFVLDRMGIPFPRDPDATNLERKLLSPNATNWLGTDNLGRDVLSRILNGAYISLTVGFVAVFVSLSIGVVVGAISGYFGKWVDNVIMRVVDALMCFPTFFLILTAVALLGPSLLNIIVVIGLVSWTGTARLVRAEFLTLRESSYVQAARALGQKSWKIIFRHILPNAAAPIVVTAVLGVPEAILAEAGLSFLGFGVQPPQATWGNIIADGKTYILDAWWLILFPGLAILVAALSFYLTGDALRQAVETRSERQ